MLESSDDTQEKRTSVWKKVEQLNCLQSWAAYSHKHIERDESGMKNIMNIGVRNSQDKKKEKHIFSSSSGIRIMTNSMPATETKTVIDSNNKLCPQKNKSKLIKGFR